MLSDHERETLLDIEHQLLTEDPRWTRAFNATTQRVSRHRALQRAAHIVALVLAMSLTVLMLAAQAPGPVVFFAAVSGLLIWLMRGIRRAHANTSQAGTGPPQA